MDFVLTGADGHVIRDTRRERIDAKINLSQLSARYFNDPVANSVLRSYAAAVNDPRNELVHLYEVRDALTKHFNGEAAAISAIGISSSQWSRLGRLANHEPFTQGAIAGSSLVHSAMPQTRNSQKPARSHVEWFKVICFNYIVRFRRDAGI